MSTATAERRPATASAPLAGGTSADARNGSPLRRARTYITLIGLAGVLLTCLVGYQVARKPSVHWAQVNVLFLLPKSSVSPNSLVGRSSSLVVIAGAIGKMVDPDSAGTRVVSPSVTLVNQGIRHGYSVTLPNDGGQWANRFDKALLDVQAVGPSVSGVSQTVQRLVGEINANLEAMQDRSGVAEVDRIHTSLDPSQMQVYDVGGHPARALAATVAIGFALTAVAVLFARRRLLSTVRAGVVA